MCLGGFILFLSFSRIYAFTISLGESISSPLKEEVRVNQLGDFTLSIILTECPGKIKGVSTHLMFNPSAVQIANEEGTQPVSELTSLRSEDKVLRNEVNNEEGFIKYDVVFVDSNDFISLDCPLEVVKINFKAVSSGTNFFQFYTPDCKVAIEGQTEVRIPDKSPLTTVYETDIYPPDSQVDKVELVSVSKYAKTYNVRVYWSGQDLVSWGGKEFLGSGIKLFNLQYKEVDKTGKLIKDWTNWWTDEELYCFREFTGTIGHNYYFRSQAEDYAGYKNDYPEGGDKIKSTHPLFINDPSFTTSGEFISLHNYPNPATNYTYIYVKLTGADWQRAKIEIYNLAGRLIREVEDNNISLKCESGEWVYKRLENLDALANGTYIYRVIMQGSNKSYSKMGKLVIIR